MSGKKQPIATFICHRHSNVAGQEGPFEAPVHYLPDALDDNPMAYTHIDCPVCARVYTLNNKSALVFESDRELEVLKIEWR